MVATFLEEFKQQAKELGVIFYQRKKNLQALLDLELNPSQREKVLNQLEVGDFYKGPKEDGIVKGTLFWEFGRVVKGNVIYIKISLGVEGKPVRCISFHPAAREITHPFKVQSISWNQGKYEKQGVSWRKINQ